MMRTTIRLALLASALVLAGCGHHHRHGGGMPGGAGTVSPQQNENPRVLTDARGNLYVGLEPLRFYRRDYKEGQVRVTWRLPPDSPWVFDAKEGIVVEHLPGQQGPTGFICGQGQTEREFSCLNTFAARGELKYSVKLRGKGGDVKVLDPRLINEWE